MPWEERGRTFSMSRLRLQISLRQYDEKSRGDRVNQDQQAGCRRRIVKKGRLVVCGE